MFLLVSSPLGAAPPDAGSKADTTSERPSARDAGEPPSNRADTSSSSARSDAEAASRDASSASVDARVRAERRFQALRTRFVDRYGLDNEALDDPERLGAWIERFEMRSTQLDGRLEALDERIRRLRTRANWNDDQIADDSLPEAAQGPLRRESATIRARRGMRIARRTSLEALRASLEQDRQLFETHRQQLLTRARSSTSDEGPDAGPDAGTSSPQQVQKAQQTEREALAELQQMTARQRQARDRRVRDLIERRRELLSKIADLAGERSELIPQLKRNHHAQVETFTKRREKLESKLDARLEPLPSERDQSKLDALFETLVRHRREARTAYREARDKLRDTQRRKADRREAYEQARTSLEQTKSQFRGLGTSELGEQRITLAETRLKYRRLRLNQTTDVLEARRKDLAFRDDKIAFYTGSIERLLPHVSESVRAPFYSIWRSANWESARASLAESARQLRDRVETRFEQFRSLPDRLYSVELWGWTLGLLWRLAFIPFLLYVVRHYGRLAVRRGLDFLLHRSFFRRHAGGTIKVGECLRTLVWPLALYAVLHYNLVYVGETLPEARSLDRMLLAGFVYWIGMDLVKLFALPRALRERGDNWAPAPDLGRLSDQQGPASHAEDVVDLTELDVDEGRKLVRTVRHVLLFGILAWLLPRLTADIMGHSVIWWLVGQAFAWGTGLVAYLELSSWRDEVTRGFEYFADERMPRAVTFVQNHKDRIYGVLLIALVTVYLVAAEIAVLGRRYLLDMEWSQRISNFLFRKKIELQREDVADEREQTTHRDLPDDYCARFDERPLFDANYLIDREEILTSIQTDVQRWCSNRRRGALALYGEAGIGKTTLLNRLYREWQRDLDLSVCYAHLVDKVTDVESVRRLLADLFHLEDPPTDREAFVERLRRCDPRIVLVDDCHHMFFRKIGGFRALAFFFNVVNLTDDRHYWLLTSNKFGWRYLQRVQEHQHFFGESLHIEPWSVEQIRSLIQRRNERTPYNISFTDLVLTRDEDRDDFYEVVQTANGYFRLLREFCQGNPRIALDFWRRNLIPQEDGTLRVSLFKQPSTAVLADLSDDHLFALTALAQHGALSAGEVAAIINADQGFCKMALNYFEELTLAERVPGTRRYRLTTFYFRPVIERLTKLNFLWV